MLRLVMSMRIEKMGGYGDFGRYVFQSALSSFDVDMYKMFNYAVYHIINDLGCTEDLFGDNDSHVGGYDAESHRITNIRGPASLRRCPHGCCAPTEADSQACN